MPFFRLSLRLQVLAMGEFMGRDPEYTDPSPSGHYLT
jgi:hypothetical protein